VDLHCAVASATELLGEHLGRPRRKTPLRDLPGGVNRFKELGRASRLVEVILPTIAAESMNGVASAPAALSTTQSQYTRATATCAAIVQIGQ
jgi:hypothetical protein